MDNFLIEVVTLLTTVNALLKLLIVQWDVRGGEGGIYLL